MSGRVGRAGRLPRWWKGKKILDDIDGSEQFELSGKIFKQRGLNVTKDNFDSLTDVERENQINNSR